MTSKELLLLPRGLDGGSAVRYDLPFACRDRGRSSPTPVTAPLHWCPVNTWGFLGWSRLSWSAGVWSKVLPSLP